VSVGLHLVVAVPARNEEARIGAALDAIAAAAARLTATLPAWTATVVVAADACTDRTAEIVLDAGVELVRTSAGRVGIARSAAIERGLELSPEACWVASTDADSRVPPDWLLEHAAAASAGDDLLLGSIRPDQHEMEAERFLRWLRHNPPVEHHDFIHGANLGIAVDAYRAAGGFPEADTDEDVLLVERCRALGSRVRATDRAPVVTSARTRGRTPGGFSEYIRSLSLSVEPS
jgi:glycosyltransferase involved in cell wall biosynthesis